jgi:hypothetical protein
VPAWFRSSHGGYPGNAWIADFGPRVQVMMLEWRLCPLRQRRDNGTSIT